MAITRSHHHVQEHIPSVCLVPHQVQFLKCKLYFTTQQTWHQRLEAVKALQPMRVKKHRILHTPICYTELYGGQFYLH